MKVSFKVGRNLVFLNTPGSRDMFALPTTRVPLALQERVEGLPTSDSREFAPILTLRSRKLRRVVADYSNEENTRRAYHMHTSPIRMGM